MRMTTKKYPVLGWILLALVFSGVSAASEAPEVLVPPEGAHLTGAWVPEAGPALMAWENTEAMLSGIVLYRDGQPVREWTFDDVLVKDARWLVPGQTLRLGVVTEGRSETRVYSLADDALELVGTTAPLEERWGSIALSPDGREWAGARFGDGEVTLATGELATHSVVHEWELKDPGTAPTGPGVIEELNRVAFLDPAGSQPVLALLWDGRLWLSTPDGSRQTRLAPPGDCGSVQSFNAVEGGLWAHCYRGRGKQPPGLWGFYPAALPAGPERPAARTLAAFRKPLFHGRDVVLDLDRRRGTADVHALVPGAAEPAPLGTLDLPAPGARYLEAGDALLLAIDGAETYRVLPLTPRLEDLRRGNPGA